MSECLPLALGAGCLFAALWFDDLVAAGRMILSATRRRWSRHGNRTAMKANRVCRRTKPEAVAALILLAVNCSASSVVTERFLDRLSFLESRNQANAIGDHGTAVGLFQMRRAAWVDVNRLRGSNIPFSKATNPATARVFARAYLLHLESHLAASTRKAPTKTSVYCAWNLGHKGFQRRGFLLSNCPRTTQRTAAKL